MGVRGTLVRIGLLGCLLATFLASPSPVHAATGTCTINTDDPFKTGSHIGGTEP